MCIWLYCQAACDPCNDLIFLDVTLRVVLRELLVYMVAGCPYSHWGVFSFPADGNVVWTRQS